MIDPRTRPAYRFPLALFLILTPGLDGEEG